MSRTEFDVVIRRSVEDVFAVLSDVENTSSWYPSPVEETWTSSGPVGVGSTRKSIGRAYGVRTENEAEVTVFEPNQALGLRSISGPVPFEISIFFTEVDGGTRVTWINDLEPTGLLRFVVALTSPLHERQTRRSLENLRRMMESNQL